MPRFSRPCYDKWWRCPGWAGGGMKYAKVKRCEGGSLANLHEWTRRCRWHCHRCPECDVIVLPIMVQWLDWSHWKWWLPYTIRELKYRWETRR